MVEVCIFTKRVVLFQLIIKFRPKHYFDKIQYCSKTFMNCQFLSKKTLYHEISKVDYTKKLDNLVKILKIIQLFSIYTHKITKFLC